MAFAVAALVGIVAYRLGTLTRSGALGATFVGGVAFHAGLAWGAYLLLWFGIATLASRVGAQRKAERSGGIIAKGRQRDIGQVLANGGVFALAAVSAAPWGDLPFAPFATPIVADIAAPIASAALAAAGADTLATECGMLWGGRPWSLRTWRRVTPGTSGAVTLAGLLALSGGAVLFALVASWMGLITPRHMPVVALAAVAGALVDTVLGANWQARRWCAACTAETEQTVHVCGASTVHHAGLVWLDNDLVNAACTVTAALMVPILLAADVVP